jgi:hypothetical protein
VHQKSKLHKQKLKSGMEKDIKVFGGWNSKQCMVLGREEMKNPGSVNNLKTFHKNSSAQNKLKRPKKAP